MKDSSLTGQSSHDPILDILLIQFIPPFNFGLLLNITTYCYESITHLNWFGSILYVILHCHSYKDLMPPVYLLNPQPFDLRVADRIDQTFAPLIV